VWRATELPQASVHKLARGGLARYRERFTAEAGADRLTRVLEGIRTAA
jgi:hypothetical protein